MCIISFPPAIPTHYHSIICVEVEKGMLKIIFKHVFVCTGGSTHKGGCHIIFLSCCSRLVY